MASVRELYPDREILTESIRASYDFIICGAGTAGCVVARRLAENENVRVLLIEAGGSDRVSSVIDSTQWMWNIGTERDWGYKAQPSSTLNGRTPLLPMGKVLGGGSSINGLVWARGHKHDFDNWAEAAGDPEWNYESVLGIYRTIEDWQGKPDAHRRGKGGLLHVSEPKDPVPLVSSLIEGAVKIGIPHVEDINGAAMEGEGGCSIPNILVRDGVQRVSMATAYIHPYMGRTNLDILLCAEIIKLELEGKRAAGVTFRRLGRIHTVRADKEVVLSLGAINTPKLLMHSGIGDEAELRRHGLGVVQHLPGVGKNFQDHILLAGCVWEYITPEPPRNNAAEFVLITKSDPSLKTPDLMPVLEETPFASEVTATQYDLPSGPASAWTLAPGLARPDSRGQILLASANPFDAPLIEANFLSTDTDVKALIRCIEMLREIGNSAACSPHRKREVMPGNLKGLDLVNFIRNASGTYFHQSCSCKMGRDEFSVVDGRLRVYGVDGLRIADASIMPEITTGNTMAPTVIIGERAAQIIRKDHGLN